MLFSSHFGSNQFVRNRIFRVNSSGHGYMRMFSTGSSERVTFKIIDDQDVEYKVEGEIGENMMQAGLRAEVPF